MSQVVDAFTSDKNKFNSETETFRDPRIVDLDSEPELYLIESLNR